MTNPHGVSLTAATGEKPDTSFRKIENYTNHSRCVVTYQVGDRRCDFDVDYIKAVGLKVALREAGLEVTNKRLPVHQGERIIGTLPETFDPQFTRSTSFWYDVRPGDFKREGDRWVASNSLCPGDLEAVPGFVWERE